MTLSKGLSYMTTKGNNESTWLFVARIILIFVTGELAASILRAHAELAYVGGLLLGLALEIMIFPSLGRKRNVVVLLVVLAAGATRYFFKFASP
jgi:hypothetical protein